MQREECGAHNNQDGFTLIEAIMTLVILSIAALGVLAVFTIGVKGGANPLLINQAIGLAQEKMETIISDRENPSRDFAYIKPGNYLAENAASLGFAGFSRTTNIICVNAATLNTDNTQTPPCTTSGYAHVTVTVTNAALGSVSVETIVANY
jgi:prepilin-type N-terminal cleavage/methylation domain-containing protein